MIRRRSANNNQCRDRQVTLATADRLGAPVMHDRMKRIAFRVLMGLNQRVGQQALHHSLEVDLAARQLLKPVPLLAAVASTVEQPISNILMVQICPHLQQLHRRSVAVPDAVVGDRPRCLDAPVLVITQTRCLRRELRPRNLVQIQVLRAARLDFAHIRARLNKREREIA